jgi:4-hydroxy-3-polyprenylbenzoate decarboxylase
LPARPTEIKKFLCAHFSAQAHQLSIYGEKHWTAPIASGSGVNKAMIVCPCTTGTLAAAATGQSRSLIERAIDVTLKERKQLLLVVRETPFSEIHLKNMLKLSRMGALIMPANPGFYHCPKSVDDVVDFMVARILDQLDIPHTLVPSWGKTIVQDAG